MSVPAPLTEVNPKRTQPWNLFRKGEQTKEGEWVRDIQQQLKGCLRTETDRKYSLLRKLADFVDFDSKRWELVFSDPGLFDLVREGVFGGSFLEFSKQKGALADFLLNAFKTKSSFRLPRDNLFRIVYLCFEKQPGEPQLNELSLFNILLKHSEEEWRGFVYSSSKMGAKFIRPLLKPMPLES